MATINRKPKITTAEGGKAKPINPEQQLRRSVMACMLWEKEFYENGESISDRIAECVKQLPAETCSKIAIEARTQQNLRHVPLLICATMAKHHRGRIVGDTIAEIIQRADELTELLVIVAHVNGVTPDNVKSVLSNQVKRGVAKAFTKFNEYQFAKYNRDGAIRLRDAMFLTHPKPVDKKQHYVFKRLAADELKTPDTWEVGLSTGGDKKETFTRLLQEGKLGYMALLRNLRNMIDAGVEHDLITNALGNIQFAKRVLPFRFLAAANAAPSLATEIDWAMRAVIDDQPKLKGKTLVLVDVSYSMVGAPVSRKSDLTRLDAASALGAMVNSEQTRVFTFSQEVVETKALRGLAGIDGIKNSQRNSCTYLGAAVRQMNTIPHDRLIVITDEQSHDTVPDPVAKHAYMINVASNKNGVGYGRWTHIDGFSEAVLKYITALET